METTEKSRNGNNEIGNNIPRDEDGAKPTEATQEHQGPTQEQEGDKKLKRTGKEAKRRRKEENKKLVECHHQIRIIHSETSHNDKWMKK